MIQSLNKKLMKKETMTENEACYFMESLVNGSVTDAEAISILSLMSYRGETAEEITGFVKALRRLSKQINRKSNDEVMDTCGTGGDGASTFNISTAVSIILSSLGIKVAKHGNKAVTSKSGSSDVLDALGIKVATNSYEANTQLDKHDIAFLHAPYFHPALKKVAHLRRQLPFRTIFNIVGPLLNPMSPAYQLIGVSDENAARAMAEAIKKLGTKKAVLVTGKDGLDECSITGETKMFLVENNEVIDFIFTPEEAGLKRGQLTDITVNDKQESAELIISILKGQGNESARNIVILNAAAALFASNRVNRIKDGVEVIEQCLSSGTAYKHLLAMNKEEEKALVN
ncbi:anthranilate phosphoribosyltransferase [Fictibacillus phosphorivorans]|uniref:anthranilate phosphoribosyltransferase n=1 Tax=Fictibacillus phosphorivorans TaxID=1221500 RepID=UPI00203C59E9|nr:anthranilate phosphoribosyltransferase [Fictibacillus phosphorivorans]MCM3718930.1 anthranilate phosphoribosyltransferase [Fictibacillus phosphorivorans]MCM3776552.1 anthranilate phosphoribosyltransferase [Fictibacillus phosphorivorans]